jgi:hypothetical protein
MLSTYAVKAQRDRAKGRLKANDVQQRHRQRQHLYTCKASVLTDIARDKAPVIMAVARIIQGLAEKTTNTNPSFGTPANR